MLDGNGSIRIVETGNVPICQADAAREHALLQSRVDRSDKTYRQLLADINLMV
jgi:glutamate mutase epsilon subunit